MLSFIIQSVCTGVTTGGAVLIAQYKGARDARGQRETTGALFSVSALAALLVTAAGLLAYRPVFTLMNLPAEALPHALRYMRVICLGTVFVFGYNAVCSVLRGLGDSKSPLFFVAVATVVNILLDLLLVGPLGLGTQGAAIATAASQGVSFLTAVVVLRRRGLPLVFSPAYFRTAPKTCRAILRIGFPAAVQMAVLNLSYLLVTGMLNGYGVAVAAAAGVGLKVNSFAAMPCWAVGQAVTTMAGQNLGAGDTGRAAQTARSGLRLALLVTAASILAVQLFTAQIIGFFNTDPEVVREGVFYLRVCCSFNSLVYAVMYTFDSFATGAGDSLFAMLNAMLHSVVMRLALSWLLSVPLGLGFAGLCWGECLSPLLPFVFGIVYFRSGRWKRKRLVS